MERHEKATPVYPAVERLRALATALRTVPVGPADDLSAIGRAAADLAEAQSTIEYDYDGGPSGEESDRAQRAIARCVDLVASLSPADLRKLYYPSASEPNGDAARRLLALRVSDAAEAFMAYSRRIAAGGAAAAPPLAPQDSAVVAAHSAARWVHAALVIHIRGGYRQGRQGRHGMVSLLTRCHEAIIYVTAPGSGCAPDQRWRVDAAREAVYACLEAIARAPDMRRSRSCDKCSCFEELPYGTKEAECRVEALARIVEVTFKDMIRYAVVDPAASEPPAVEHFRGIAAAAKRRRGAAAAGAEEPEGG